MSDKRDLNAYALGGIVVLAVTTICVVALLTDNAELAAQVLAIAAALGFVAIFVI